MNTLIFTKKRVATNLQNRKRLLLQILMVTSGTSSYSNEKLTSSILLVKTTTFTESPLKMYLYHGFLTDPPNRVA